MDIDCGYIKYENIPEDFFEKISEYRERQELLKSIIVDLIMHKDKKIVNVFYSYSNGDVSCGLYSKLYGIDEIYYRGKDLSDIYNQIVNKGLV